jgi:hypothetical protein
MRQVKVSIVGKDGETHSRTVDALSLFDACDTAMMDWNKLWWWSSSAVIEVESKQFRPNSENARAVPSRSRF